MRILIMILTLICCSWSFAKQIPLDTTTSTIEWLGQKKVPGGDHKGTIKVKKGSISLNKSNELSGGSIIIDMKSIEDTDLSGKWKKQLEEHLHSEDFFHTKKHPEATFKITKVEKTRSNLVKVTGNLTLRGTTHTESFEFKVESKKEKKKRFMVATGQISFDRNKYGVTYRSETSVLKKALKLAKDKIIKDTIQLTVTLKTAQL